MSHEDLDQLVRGLRQGDSAAVRELIARYEPFLRRALRLRIAQAKLHSAADSADICQSVMQSFYVRVVAGEYELSSVADLEKLLLGIARKKFAMFARREFAARRNRKREFPLGEQFDCPDTKAVDPGQFALSQDLISAVRERLRDGERELFDLRKEGKSWDDVARERGKSALVLRKQLSRAINRVSIELGLDSNGETDLRD